MNEEKCDAVHPEKGCICMRPKGHTDEHVGRVAGEIFNEIVMWHVMWDDTPPPLSVSVEEKVETQDKPG